MGCGNSQPESTTAPTDVLAAPTPAEVVAVAIAVPAVPRDHEFAAALNFKSAVAADEAITASLSLHIATTIGTTLPSAVVHDYVTALRSEGCDSPADFDELTIDELKEAPFSFKRLHAKKVSKARSISRDIGANPSLVHDQVLDQVQVTTSQDSADHAEQQPKKVVSQDIKDNPFTSPPPSLSSGIRGQCSLCDQDVLDSQPRLKHVKTGLYQHENCQAAAKAVPAKGTAIKRSPTNLGNLGSYLATGGLDIHGQGANAEHAAAEEQVHAEVAAIKAAADAARAEIIAEAKRNARATVIQAHTDALQISRQAAAQLQRDLAIANDAEDGGVAIAQATVSTVADATAIIADATATTAQQAKQPRLLTRPARNLINVCIAAASIGKKSSHAQLPTLTGLTFTRTSADTPPTEENQGLLEQLEDNGDPLKVEQEVEGINAARSSNEPAPETSTRHAPLAHQTIARPSLPSGQHAFLSYQWDVQDQQTFADACWKISATFLDLDLDMQNMTHNVVTVADDGADKATAQGVDGARVEENQVKAKMLMPWAIMVAGEAITSSPGFGWQCFGASGEKLVECHNAYAQHEKHHNEVYDRGATEDTASNGTLLPLHTHATFGAAPWILAMQYGRIKDAKNMLKANLVQTKKLMMLPESATFCINYTIAVVWSACFLPWMHHVLGVSHHCQAHFDMLGLTFHNVEERINALTKPAQGTFFTPMGGAGGGLFSLKRIVWQIKALFILHSASVTPSEAVAWLEALPISAESQEAFRECSMSQPTHDHGAIHNLYHACWLALAHEKVGLCTGAIVFADLQLETDVQKAGVPSTKWAAVIALACKGRVLAKLKRRNDALVAFHAAIVTSKESYSLVQAFAYREMANYADGGDAAVLANDDLNATLKAHEGWTTRADFDTLTISPFLTTE